MKEGLLVVVSGPSGAGKGTVVSKLVENGDYALSISATTRSPRENEVDGVNYFFKTTEEFESMIKEGQFLEYARFCNNYYGTPMPYINETRKAGRDIILEIEVQGALQVREKYPDAVLVFLAPPSMEELKNRLIGRGTETMEVVAGRLERAEEELDLIDNYDYIVVNNDIADAVADIRAIISAESNRVERNSDIKSRLKGV